MNYINEDSENGDCTRGIMELNWMDKNKIKK